MEDRRRTVLAIALMLIVAVVPSLFLKNRPSQQPLPDVGPSAPLVSGERLPQGSGDVGAAEVPTAVPAAPTPAIVPPAESTVGHPTDKAVVVRSGLYEYRFSTRGARLSGATLRGYDTHTPGQSGPARILPEDSEFLSYRLVFGSDTVVVADWAFQPSDTVVDVGPEGGRLTWIARRGVVSLRLTYTFEPDRYLFRVRGELEGLTTDPPLLLIGLGPRLSSVEVDSLEDQRSYGIVTKARNTKNHKFSSLDPGERLDLEGPFEWVAIKSKYFLGAILAIDEGVPTFGGGLAVGGTSAGRRTSRAHVTASLPAPGATFSHSVYVGPQEYRRLARIGHDLTDVNPYGWIFRPVIGPVSILIVRALLWMHENLHVAYGWLLVFFGVGIRLLLWPLNHKAMRSQMAMQALQPEIEALRQKHKADQQKLGQETMKLYRERGANPLGGCLPMLLPMPILLAFFFVFLNTIELRGVPFLWLPDLARPDPLYLIPLLMGASMFAVSRLGQKGVPPNPQAKIMMYVMPVFFTVIFLKFASGLNLYYASQNIASIPQQWMIARERLKKNLGSGS